MVDEPQHSILEELNPKFLPPMALDYIRNEMDIARNHGGDPELFKNGDLEVISSIKTLYFANFDDLNDLLDKKAETDPDVQRMAAFSPDHPLSVEEKRKILIEKDPILGPVSRMDGIAGLSQEEFNATMLALDALPHAQKNSVGIETARIVNVNGETGEIEKLPNRKTFQMGAIGIGATIQQTDLDIATNHMKEFLATARQFLGDNYQVQVKDENGQNVDTRDPEVDREYTQLIRDAVKDIRKEVDHGYHTRPSGGGRGGR